MPWNLTGNANVNPATQFLGTTDNQPLIIKINRTEAMRVSSDCYVGIGTSSPAGSLHIGAPTPNIFLVGNTTTNQDGMRVHYNESAALRAGVIDVKGLSLRIRGESSNFGEGGTDRMFIDLTNGNVGIENTAPKGKLHIGGSMPDIFLVGNTTNNEDGLRIHYNESTRLRAGIIDVKGDSLRIRGESGATGNGETERMHIDFSSGHIGIGTTKPVFRLDVSDVETIGLRAANDIRIINATNSGDGYAVHGGVDQGNTFGGLGYRESYTDIEAGVLTRSVGVKGSSPHYRGVEGISENGTGVFGSSTHFHGVEGTTETGIGVVGSATSGLAGDFHGTVQIRNHMSQPALIVGQGTGNSDVELNGTLFVGTGLPTLSAGMARIRIGADRANNDIEIGSANPNIQNITLWNSGSGSLMTAAGRAFNSVSDARLKSNIQPLTDVMEKLDQIRGVSFEWNGNPIERREVGVIAQEVEAAFPELVTTLGNNGYKMVDYGKLSAVLIEAVKQLKSENGKLRSRLDALELLASSAKDAGEGYHM